MVSSVPQTSWHFCWRVQFSSTLDISTSELSCHSQPWHFYWRIQIPSPIGISTGEFNFPAPLTFQLVSSDPHHPRHFYWRIQSPRALEFPKPLNISNWWDRFPQPPWCFYWCDQFFSHLTICVDVFNCPIYTSIDVSNSPDPFILLLMWLIPSHLTFLLWDQFSKPLHISIWEFNSPDSLACWLVRSHPPHSLHFCWWAQFPSPPLPVSWLI